MESCRVTRNGYREDSDESNEGRWETILTYFNTNEYGHRNVTLDSNYTLMTSGTRDLTATWYVVRGTVTVDHRLNVEDGASVNILLLNGAVLKATDGIYVDSYSSLRIYGESEEDGLLIAKGSSNGAGIGGGFRAENDNVTVTITGGRVYAEGRGTSAGIGGGGTGDDEGNGNKVTITGGTVTAVSQEHAIGKGGNQWSNHHNTLELYPLAWVKAGSSEDDAIPAASGDRVDSCRDSHYVRIEPCTHENAAYTFDGSAHTGVCPNCLRGPLEEPHRFAEGICEVCGYQTPNWVIDFDPNGGTGTMPAMEVTPGASALLPGCSFRAPDGMAFTAWQINGEDYPAGASFTPNDHLTAQAVWGESTWSLLQAQINSAGDGQTVVLTADLAAAASDATLTIPEGKRVTLDLNGHTLSGSGVLGVILNVENGAELTLTDTVGGGAVTRAMWYGIYVKRNSSLSMQDVEISSCGAGLQIYGAVTMSGGAIRNCTSEGGVVLYSPGSFTLTDGSITGNEASSSYTDGGGVTVNGGTFRMTGGRIARNSGKGSGGVYVQTASGYFIMEGGSVTANTSQYGGVYVTGNSYGDRVALSGSATITGNTGADGVAANLVLAKNSSGNFTHINMAAGSVGGRVGVTIEPYSSSDTDLTPAFTTGLNGRSVGGFFSDNAAYIVGLSGDGEACFINPNVLATPDFVIPSGTLGIESEAFAGIGATVVYIPDGCGSIGATAFRDCSNLRQIRIPAGCAIGVDAFAGDFGLKVFGYRGSSAETYCREHLYCSFVPLD